MRRAIVAEEYIKRGPTAADQQWLRARSCARRSISRARALLRIDGEAADVDSSPPHRSRTTGPSRRRAGVVQDTVWEVVSLEYRTTVRYWSRRRDCRMCSTPRQSPRLVIAGAHHVRTAGAKRPACSVTSDLESFWARGIRRRQEPGPIPEAQVAGENRRKLPTRVVARQFLAFIAEQQPFAPPSRWAAWDKPSSASPRRRRRRAPAGACGPRGSAAVAWPNFRPGSDDTGVTARERLDQAEERGRPRATVFSDGPSKQPDCRGAARDSARHDPDTRHRQSSESVLNGSEVRYENTPFQARFSIARSGGHLRGGDSPETRRRRSVRRRRVARRCRRTDHSRSGAALAMRPSPRRCGWS
jgi:hypothetical protein